MAFAGEDQNTCWKTCPIATSLTKIPMFRSFMTSSLCQGWVQIVLFLSYFLSQF